MNTPKNQKVPTSQMPPVCEDLLQSQQGHSLGFSCMVSVTPRVETSQETQSECILLDIFEKVTGVETELREMGRG